jgi:nucleoporin p58/p45
MALSFGSSAPPNPFQTPAPVPAAQSSSPSPFQFSFQQQQQQQQQQPQPQQQAAQPQQQQQLLCTKDGKPAGYATKWEELHADTQKALLQIE